MAATRLYDHSNFKVSMVGPEGPYYLTFKSDHDSDGVIDVSIGHVEMAWWVTRIERQDDNHVCFSGMTAGSEAIWNDQFFFELLIGPDGSAVRYWGDRVIWRTDFGGEMILSTRTATP